MNPNQDSFLSLEERKLLLQISRESLEHYFQKGTKIEFREKDIPGNLQVVTGAFVSMYVDGALRGCIGRLSADIPLFKLIQQMSVSAATQDTRFNSIENIELALVRIELSVLTPMKRIYDISELKLGRHGIYIKEGYNSGTFLPQVAENTNWSKEEFLGYCSRDKARIGWNGWKTAELYIYESIIIKES